MAEPFELTTVARAKQALGHEGQKKDGYIRQLIRTVSAEIANFTNRRDGIEERSRTEVKDIEPGQRWFRLDASPIASITSVIFEIKNDFANGSVITSDNFLTKPESGLLYLQFNLVSHAEPTRPQSLQVVYVGGIASNLAGLRNSDYADLEQAAWLWIQAILKRQKTVPGTVSISGQGGSVSLGVLGMPDAVTTILRRHRRLNVA